MNIINKFLKINILENFILQNNFTLYHFLNSKQIRETLINKILSQNISYKSFKILNIIHIHETFIIEIELNIYTTSIIRFESIQNILIFCLYLNKNKEKYFENNSTNINLYFLDNYFYLIIENQDIYNINFSDFEFIKYSPLIHSKIIENGFKLSS